MKIITLLLISVFFTTTSVFSQKKQNKEIDELVHQATEVELVNKSTSLLYDKAYVDAEKVIDKLLVFQPESPNYNYRKGYVVIMLRQDYAGALPYLTKGATKVSKVYDMFSAKELNASVDALYYLGKTYHHLGRISEAKAMYSEFIEKSDKKSDVMKYAYLGIQQCAIAEQQLKTPNQGVTVKNTGNKVNSSYPEYSPVISLDGSALFFTVRKPWENNISDQLLEKKTGLYLEDIYASFLDENNQWKEPVRMDFSVADRNEATVAISIEERIIYSYTDETGKGDIYFSDFKDNQFDSPKIFTAKNVNTDAWESHLTISPSGDLMYFVSDRAGGFGGRDIYESKKKADGTWGEPVNMGSKVNTPFDEESPFISVNEKHFYFASNGPKSMGGFDILYSTKNADGSWGESVNIGYPLNSYGDDLYYTSTMDGYLGYFTSNRPGGEGEKDIYEVENNYLGIENIAFLKVKVNTVDNVKIPDSYRVVLKCVDCADKNERIVYTRPRDGMIMSFLEPCKTYKLEYQMGDDHQVIFQETITTECEMAYQEINREQLIDVLKKKKVDVEEVEEIPVVANKVMEVIFYFKYNKNKLFVGNREFKNFMREVDAQLVDNNESVVIKINSSASKVPTTKFANNEELSLTRAENLKYDIINYLDKNSANKNRISIVIVDSVVAGPDFENDKKDRDKYEPYQFSKLRTEN